MDLVTFAFLALIALVSGGIAYFADWLGRKLGKKRLRLGALRPKHTAALGVVTSGVVISVITIGLVYGLSYDVRQWITKGRRAIRDLESAQKQRDAAIADSQRISASNKLLRSDGLRSQVEIQHARKTLATLSKSTALLRSEIAANRIAATKLQEELRRVNMEYVASTSSLAFTEKQRSQALNSLTQIQSQYRSLNQSYKALASMSKEIKDENLKVTADNLALSGSNNQLKLDNTSLQTNLHSIMEATAKSLEKLDGLNAEIARQTVVISQQQDKIDDQLSKLREGAVLTAALDKSVASSREHSLTFAIHEEITRESVSPKLSEQAARDAITSLLRSSRSAAVARGAAAAMIFPREDRLSQSSITPEEIVDRMVRRIVGRPDEQVLVATSTYNAFAGESVSIDLNVFPNPLVYRGGQVIAEAVIDGTDSEDRILAQVTDLLKRKVRTRAKSDHLIPGGDDSYGNVDGVEIFKIVKTVQSAERLVRVQAVARNDTRAGDPLEIDLRIR